MCLLGAAQLEITSMHRWPRQRPCSPAGANLYRKSCQLPSYTDVESVWRFPVMQLSPQQAVMARAPSALPSAIQAGLSTPVAPYVKATGGRKMLQSAPDCCNSYTVKPGDTLASIASAYGQPDNGAHIMQARGIFAYTRPFFLVLVFF